MKLQVIIGLFLCASTYAHAQTIQTPHRIVTIHSAGGYLGVGVVELDNPDAKADVHGVQIKHVDEDSPAAKAGFKEGDVVVEYNGQRVEGVDQFIRLVRETPSGRTVKMQVLRDGATQTLTATLGTRKTMWSQDGPDFPDVPMPPIPPLQLPDFRLFAHQNASIGIDVQALGQQLAEYFGVKSGVLVVNVVRDSPAQKAGLKAGDVITRVNGDPVATPHDITAHLHNQPAKPLPFTITRNHHELSLDVSPAQP